MDPKAYLHSQISEKETIIWEGRPLKKAMLFQAIFGMLPICVIWILFASLFIGVTFIGGAPLSILIFIIPFFAVWLTPVWVWLSQIIGAGIAYEKTYYIVTNKRILLMHGAVLSREFENLYFQNVGDIHLRIGFIDHLCHTGTIIINVRGHEYATHTIANLEDAETVFQNMQKCIFDMASDVYYPNEMRPTENHGYQTEYQG